MTPTRLTHGRVHLRTPPLPNKGHTPSARARPEIPFSGAGCPPRATVGHPIYLDAEAHSQVALHLLLRLLVVVVEGPKVYEAGHERLLHVRRCLVSLFSSIFGKMPCASMGTSMPSGTPWRAHGHLSHMSSSKGRGRYSKSRGSALPLPPTQTRRTRFHFTTNTRHGPPKSFWPKLSATFRASGCNLTKDWNSAATAELNTRGTSHRTSIQDSDHGYEPSVAPTGQPRQWTSQSTRAPVSASTALADGHARRTLRLAQSHKFLPPAMGKGSTKRPPHAHEAVWF